MSEPEKRYDFGQLPEVTAGPAPEPAELPYIPEQGLYPPEFAPRSPGWEKFAKAFLANYPHCVVCKTAKSCVPHHVEPYHLRPDLELDSDNLVTLCPPHHLLFGHFMEWRSYNLNVRHDAAFYANKIAHRPKG